ncbi:complement component receptor 1-like protein [Varanus komodoensis]|uniref:complement component receptor 1-like protein n=1 Tax=Varanus komodoensis TaxID=61221 RepID=UPI001CF79101|nr:complement component receptor 1-like protein [Varanus komodoensis]
MIGSYLIKCTRNSSWYPEVPSCKKITSELCGAPLIPSGKVEPLQPQYEIGHVIDVHCDANYCFPDETIEMSVQCQGYNLWNPPVQPCFFRTSHDTSELFIHNGKIIRGKKNIYKPGDKVTVECNAGFALSGPAEIRYIGGKKWLPAIPTCSLNAFFILLITAFVLIVLLLAIKMIYQKYRSL